MQKAVQETHRLILSAIILELEFDCVSEENHDPSVLGRRDGC